MPHLRKHVITLTFCSSSAKRATSQPLTGAGWSARFLAGAFAESVRRSGSRVADMMRRVTELGKGRTANKLRSYMRAAYQTARASRSKASIPLHFKPYKVTTNPVSAKMTANRPA